MVEYLLNLENGEVLFSNIFFSVSMVTMIMSMVALVVLMVSPKKGVVLLVLGGVGMISSMVLYSNWEEQIDNHVTAEFGAKYGVYYSKGKVFKFNEVSPTTPEQDPAISLGMGLKFVPKQVYREETPKKEYLGKLTCELSIIECNRRLVQNRDRVLAHMLTEKMVVSK